MGWRYGIPVWIWVLRGVTVQLTRCHNRRKDNRLSLLSAVITLLLVMDPLGNVPLFIAALKGVPESRVRRVIVRELLIALLILIIFLFTGRALLTVMNISDEALNVGGGMILLLIAIQMIFPVDEHAGKAVPKDEPFIVPLAVPYTVGPSVLAAAMLLMSQDPQLWYRWLAAAVIAWGITAVLLYNSANVASWIGEKGVVAMERLMGMILVFLAVQMLMTGIRDFFMG